MTEHSYASLLPANNTFQIAKTDFYAITEQRANAFHTALSRLKKATEIKRSSNNNYKNLIKNDLPGVANNSEKWRAKCSEMASLQLHSEPVMLGRSL